MAIAFMIYVLFIRRTPKSTLFPYTTLFRSLRNEQSIKDIVWSVNSDNEPSESSIVVHLKNPERKVEYFPVITGERLVPDRKSTRLKSSHVRTSYAAFCLKKKTRLRF